MPCALDGISPALTSGELAWLATQPDVESRLVFTHAERDGTHYEVRHGPFENDILSSLPRKNWTLLVQDVEKHLPDFRALFAAVDFVPDWRIDDLMVSFAAPGGSVGPHKDNYDVFLCQGEGVREWHLGDPDSCDADESSPELSILKPFVDPNSSMNKTGDVLYLQPGIPHWGIAQDFCMTYSIGMRAPSLAELTAGAARIFDSPGNVFTKSSATGSDVFYADPDLMASEAVPGLISAAAIVRAGNLLGESAALDEQQIAILLGSVATDPKVWLEPESVTDDNMTTGLSDLHRLESLSVHGMSKLAYCETQGADFVFANGHAMSVAAGSLEFFRLLCSTRTVASAALRANGGAELLQWLLKSGVFDLTEQHE